MGCMRKVFRAEIDLAMFEAAERNGGYGGIKMTGEPLPQCQFRVEPAYEHVGPAHECVNPGFFDCGDGSDRRPHASTCGTPWPEYPRPRRATPSAPLWQPLACASRFASLTSLRSGPRPSGPGVSISAGSSSNRGSERNGRSPLRPSSPSPEVRVPVAVGAQRNLGVVDVQAAQPVEAHLGVEVVHHLGERLDRADLEPRGQQVAAVEAGAQALAASGGVDQLGKLVEVAAQRALRSSGVLEQQRRALRACRAPRGWPCRRASSKAPEALPCAPRRAGQPRQRRFHRRSAVRAPARSAIYAGSRAPCWRS